jgi:hypothetical protein
MTPTATIGTESPVAFFIFLKNLQGEVAEKGITDSPFFS